MVPGEHSQKVAGCAGSACASKDEETSCRRAETPHPGQPGDNRVEGMPQNKVVKHPFEFGPRSLRKVLQIGLHPHHPATAAATLEVW